MKAPNRRTRRAPAQQPVTRQANISMADAERAVDAHHAESDTRTMADLNEAKKPTGVPDESPPDYGQEPYEGPKSLHQQIREYLASIPADLPYNHLLDHADKAGWTWMIRQQNIQSVPYQYVIGQGQDAQVAQAPGFLVTFAVMVGRKDGEDLDYIDEVSIVLPSQVGPVSVGARTQIMPSVIYALFGRLPPLPPQQPAREQTVEMPDEDVELDIQGLDAVEIDDTPEWQRNTKPAPQMNGSDGPEVVAERTADDLPIFVDLYEVREPTIEVINAVADEIEDTLPRITTVEGLKALWSLNKDAMAFIKDLGTPEQRKRLEDMMTRRKGLIEAGFQEPRRRN